MASDDHDPKRDPGTGEIRAATPILPEQVTDLWNEFRAGTVVHCPRCRHSMAASVDGASAAYRLVCVFCGHATPWFEAKLGMITHVRGNSTRPPPP